MASLVDPTATGNYPVILGDGMLGKTSNEIFTGIRCMLMPLPFQSALPCYPAADTDGCSHADNHKPFLSSPDAPNHARLKPTVPGKTNSYDLSFTDGDGSYAYAGTRKVDSNQYILHFDPDRRAFILDKIDSTFNMNLSRHPTDQDPDNLSQKYPHLDSPSPRDPDADTNLHLDDGQPSPSKPPGRKSAPPAKPAGRKLNGDAAHHPKPPPTKSETSKPSKAAKGPRRAKADKKTKDDKAEADVGEDAQVVGRRHHHYHHHHPRRQDGHQEEEDEDDDDDDGGLLVEYPGADTAAKQTDFSPAFPPPRRFDDFMDQRDSEGDADAESDDEPDADMKLPSPVDDSHPGRHSVPDDDGGVPLDDRSSVDMEDDLEKDLKTAFEDLANSQEGSPEDAGDESEISEED